MVNLARGNLDALEGEEWPYFLKPGKGSGRDCGGGQSLISAMEFIKVEERLVSLLCVVLETKGVYKERVT